jgi:hypothetical protein
MMGWANGGYEIKSIIPNALIFLALIQTYKSVLDMFLTLLVEPATVSFLCMTSGKGKAI